MVAILGSAFGTSLTLAVMVNALYVGTVLDEMVVPILVIFTATLQVVGFAFIYGEFLLSFKLIVEVFIGTPL